MSWIAWTAASGVAAGSTSASPTPSQTSLDAGTRSAGQPYRVFVLSHPNDEETITLDTPIANTTKAASGRTFAWTMGQRYTRLSALTKPGITTTTDLEQAGG